MRALLDQLRGEVLPHYGTVCECCGTTERLSIDHVNGDGAAHRTELFGSPRGRTVAFYQWLIDNGFPEGYQTLCVPCNSSKGTGAECRIHPPRIADLRRRLRIAVEQGKQYQARVRELEQMTRRLAALEALAGVEG